MNQSYHQFDSLSLYFTLNYISNYSVIYPLLSFILYYPSQYCTNARVYKKFLTLTLLLPI